MTGAREQLQPLVGEWSVAAVWPGEELPDELRLERTKPDCSPLDFSQRFVGRMSDDGDRIDGAWHLAEDHQTWRKDFDLVYTRLAAT